MNTATHLTLIAGETVTTTNAQNITRTGRYAGFQQRANTPVTGATEYEAIVRWDGDDYDSIAPLNRLTPARDTAIQTAATVTRAWQANPTAEAFAEMIAAIDTATDLGATNDDIIATFKTLGARR
ncbi:hypothetical protein ACWHA3_02275 [Streptomyces cyaneofuscatus]